MATPTVSASLDKPTYQVGDTATLTITYTDDDSKPLSVTITVTDSSGNTSEPVTVTAVVDALTIDVSDDSGREWAKQSDSGTVAVYTTTV